MLTVCKKGLDPCNWHNQNNHGNPGQAVSISFSLHTQTHTHTQRSALGKDVVVGSTPVNVESFHIPRNPEKLIGTLFVELDYYEKPK